MSSYRCAVCGSSNVVTETKQEGYNKKKGIMGMALFGVKGAIAGVDGNSVVYYHCGACGHTLNKCMPNEEKNFIDSFVCTPDTIVRMRNLKNKYPNIEWDESLEDADYVKECIEITKEKQKLSVQANKKLVYKDRDLSIAETCTCPVCLESVSPRNDLCSQCGYPIKNHYFKELYASAECRENKKEKIVIKMWVLSQYLGIKVSELPEKQREMNEWAFNNAKVLEKITEEDIRNLSDNPKDDYVAITEFLDYTKEFVSKR